MTYEKIDMMPYLALFCATLFTMWVTYWVYRWYNPRCKNGRLPPGSMGFPAVGETFDIFIKGTAFDFLPFFKTRINRYGPLFKTSFLGRPTIVSADAELNYLVFQQEEKLFEVWYPGSFDKIFGSDNIGKLHGSMFKYVKSLAVRFFGLDQLKQLLLPEMEESARISLSSWAKKPSIDLKEAIATMTFNFTLKKLTSYKQSSSSENLRQNFFAFTRGLLSFPLYIPGTAFYQSMQGRRKVMKLLNGVLKERLNSSRRKHEDFIDTVVEELEKEDPILSESMALNLVFGFLFAGYETTTLVLTLAVKFLTDNPKALQQLTEEHDTIVKNRANPDSGITWDEYKSMTFTSQVINETMRLANVAPVIFRKALKDVNVKGYTIPAGWSVLVYSPVVHLDPEIYEDPFTFNPWRWQNSAELNSGSKRFMAFGGGKRLCVGAGFTKIVMTAFLHCLVTKYRWTAIKGGNIYRNPSIHFPDGFHVQLFSKA